MKERTITFREFSRYLGGGDYPYMTQAMPRIHQTKHVGAAEARRAHNPEDLGSKPSSASSDCDLLFLLFLSLIFLSGRESTVHLRAVSTMTSDPRMNAYSRAPPYILYHFHVYIYSTLFSISTRSLELGVSMFDSVVELHLC